MAVTTSTTVAPVQVFETTTTTTTTIAPPPPNDAPLEEKEAFEEEVNIYATEGYDDYIPADSVVDVATRRTVTAASVIISSSPVVVARRRIK